MRIRFSIAMAITLVAAAGHVRADARAEFERAMRAIDAGEFDKAVTHFSLILRSGELGDAGLAVVHQNRGHSFIALGLFDGALGDFNRALTLKPGYAEAHYGRGMALAGKRRNEAALRDFDAAIALKPEFASAHGERGQVLLRLGRHDDALDSLEEAMRLGASDWRVYNDYGIILMARDDLEGAFQSFDAAIGVGPEESLPYRNRGIMYFLVGRMVEAGFDLEQALKFGPGDLDTLVWRTIYNAYVALDLREDIAKNTTEESIRAWPGPILEMFLGKDLPGAVLETGEKQFAQGRPGCWPRPVMPSGSIISPKTTSRRRGSSSRRWWRWKGRRSSNLMPRSARSTRSGRTYRGEVGRWASKGARSCLEGTGRYVPRHGRMVPSA